MTGMYLAVLVLSLVCMTLCDYRWKLAFFDRPGRAAVLIAGVVGLLLLWDVAGVATGVFARGDSPWMLGAEIAPEIPVEEPVFLCFLAYLGLNLTAGAQRLTSRPTTREQQADGSATIGGAR